MCIYTHTNSEISTWLRRCWYPVGNVSGGKKRKRKKNKNSPYLSIGNSACVDSILVCRCCMSSTTQGSHKEAKPRPGQAQDPWSMTQDIPPPRQHTPETTLTGGFTDSLQRATESLPRPSSPPSLACDAGSTPLRGNVEELGWCHNFFPYCSYKGCLHKAVVIFIAALLISCVSEGLRNPHHGLSMQLVNLRAKWGKIQMERYGLYLASDSLQLKHVTSS